MRTAEMKSKKAILVAAMAVAAAATAGCASKASADKPARPVRVEAVRPETAAAGLRYSATIQPHEQVPMSFKVGGYVSEVRQVRGTDGRLRNLQQGDAVKRGNVLARINPADYQERVNQARAQLAEAQASLKRAEADGGRAEALYRGKALTRPEYDAALSNMAAGSARVDAAAAALEAARIALSDGSLVAPFDGVVLSRSVEVGSLAGVGTVAFTLADLSRVKAVFGVPDHLVQRVVLGASLAITSDAFAGAVFPGSITAVSPSADAQSRVFSVEVTIPNADHRLKAGMVAAVLVPPERAPA